jgi:hypothetical protein
LSEIYSTANLFCLLFPKFKIQGFRWLFWELPLNLNWEILSTFLSTKYESEMNLGNNKQNKFAVEYISLKNSEFDENHPTLVKQDMRRFSSLKYEQSFPWLYYS